MQLNLSLCICLYYRCSNSVYRLLLGLDVECRHCTKYNRRYLMWQRHTNTHSHRCPFSKAQIASMSGEIWERWHDCKAKSPINIQGRSGLLFNDTAYLSTHTHPVHGHRHTDTHTSLCQSWRALCLTNSATIIIKVEFNFSTLLVVLYPCPPLLCLCPMTSHGKLAGYIGCRKNSYCWTCRRFVGQWQTGVWKRSTKDTESCWVSHRVLAPPSVSTQL